MSEPTPPVEGARHLNSGKVRDLFDLPDGNLLMVASDRISAFDYVLTPTIPDKGEILTRMSLWWFEQLDGLIANHVISTDVPPSVAGRALVCERLAMFPVECVARGYLAGSGLVDYRATGEVCGNPLPPGLEDGSRLPEPIFTPAAKAEAGEHDENVDYEAVVADGRRRRRGRAPHADPHDLRPGGGDRPRARHHPRRHQVRVRRATGRHDRAGRRGADPGLVALLAGRRLAAGPGPDGIRQAVRPRLAAVG